MTAALLFQIVNLLVSIAMVPVLLGFLGVSDYLVWAVFTTISGLTLQLESAIQTLMIRRIASAAATGDPAITDAELGRARRAYRQLSALVLVVVLPAGWLYMRYALFDTGAEVAPRGWEIAWLVTCGAFGINYLFGHNNVALLGTARNTPFFLIGTASRLLNFSLVAAAAYLGFGLLGVALAFCVAVLLNIGCIAVATKTVRSNAVIAITGVGGAVPSGAAGLVRYTWFTMAAFVLYRGAFLVAVGVFSTVEAASYGLALQAFAILSAVAIVPLQVRLHLLVSAIRSGDRGAQDSETALALAFATLVLPAGALGLVIVGSPILALIKSNVTLPPNGVILLMTAAFLVEAFIMVFVNLLLIMQDLRFARGYLLISVAGLLCAAIAVTNGASLAIGMLAVPVALQMLVSLPLVLRLAAHASGRTSLVLLADLSRANPLAAAGLKR